jgi:hypothetical protein
LLPLARSKNDPETFAKPDAYALVGRLAAQWNYLAEQGRDDVLALEFVEQFDGYPPELVTRAATIAIGKATVNHPTAGAIKAELRALQPPPSRPAWRDDDGECYRANTPEEVARRAAQCLKWRKEYGLGSSVAGPEKPEPPPLDRPFTGAEIESAKRLVAAVRP